VQRLVYSLIGALKLVTIGAGIGIGVIAGVVGAGVVDTGVVDAGVVGAGVVVLGVVVLDVVEPDLFSSDDTCVGFADEDNIK
jgi:hypothetical protein